MVRSNEFTADSFAGAIKKATAAYDRSQILEHKDRCSDLAFDLADFKREAARAEDRAEDLKRRSEELARSARRNAQDAVVSAAIAAAGAFGSAIRAFRILKRLNLKDLKRRDWLGLVPVLGGGLLAGANALDAVRDSLEARRLAQEAERESQNANRLGEEIIEIAEKYRRFNCDESDRMS